MVTLKDTLEEEIRLHRLEQEKHYNLAKDRQSITEMKKHIKHKHKLFQTIKIAKKLDFVFCECCGGLRKR